MSLVIGRRLWLDAKHHGVKSVLLRLIFQPKFMLDLGGLRSGPLASHSLWLSLDLGSWRLGLGSFGIVDCGRVSLLAQLLYVLTARIGQRGYTNDVA